MSSSHPSAPQNNSTSSGNLWIVLVVFLCGAAIGLTGFAKIKLDESAVQLVKEDIAPASNSLSTSQKIDEITLVQNWATFLTTLSWLGLLFSAIAALTLILRSRDKTPSSLEVLTRSVSSLAQGDLATRIWGTERRDKIGELARAIDAARQGFSQLPDFSLTSDQGKMHFRFDGESKPLFQALVNTLGQQSEGMRQASQNLTNTTTQQQEVITLLSSRVEAVLNNIEKRGLDSDRQAKDSLAKVMTSAQQLRHAQEHAADQLNRILPFLQERAQGLSDMAQITGKHLSQALQSITVSERGLAASATQSEQAIQKLSSTADSLGERLFGAVNLLQASGKVLAETTEQTQSKLSEAIGRLDQGLASLSAPPDITGHIDQKLSETSAMTESKIDELRAQITTLGDSISTLHTALPQQITVPEAPNALPDAVLDHLTAHMVGLQDNITATFDKTLIKTLSQIVGHTLDEVLGEKLTQQQSEILTKIEAAIATHHNVAKDADQTAANAHQPPFVPEEILGRVKLDMALLRHDISATFDETLVKTLSQIVGQTLTNAFGEKLDERLASLPATTSVQPQTTIDHEALLSSLRQQWFQMAGQIEATRASLEQSINLKLQELHGQLISKTKTDDIPAPALLMIEQQTAILTELVSTMAMLDKNLQNMEKKLTASMHRVA